ncbi:hypothetical protein [Georgenia sp. SUBG003]|uniref:hypothetical protein n=1 Tax=Georgenia sp. SUBG003 TaxID=1497974 RepID=UPI003AB277FA
MSFDVYFQRFRDGEAEPGGGEQMRQVLEPFIVREEPELDFARLEYGDGSADVYLGGDGMMANRVAGDLPWELLVQGAEKKYSGAGCRGAPPATGSSSATSTSSWSAVATPRWRRPPS